MFFFFSSKSLISATRINSQSKEDKKVGYTIGIVHFGKNLMYSSFVSSPSSPQGFVFLLCLFLSLVFLFCVSFLSFCLFIKTNLAWIPPQSPPQAPLPGGLNKPDTILISDFSFSPDFSFHYIFLITRFFFSPDFSFHQI